ncbi:MAG: EF-hand domain-containing protein [Gemmataceae bacterium]|nr:EF-hand domain-containing protein [Gemmata sp.]MDW8197241.1 EF-hand domain-containing protein [Gemmataceae bacterium]
MAVAVFWLGVILGSSTTAAEHDQYEERSLMQTAQRWAERMTRAARSDRTLWVKALVEVFPEKATEGLLAASKDEEYEAWFDLVTAGKDEWRRDELKSPLLIEVYDKLLQRLELGPVPSIQREEFRRYCKRHLVPSTPANALMLDTKDDADKVFRVLDKNSDGELSHEELTISLKEDKVRTDLDGNGQISKDEYRAYFHRKVAAKAEEIRGKMTEHSGGRSSPSPVGNTKPATGSMPDWFTALDENADKQISLFEWRAGGKPLELFQEMDLNGDGLLTEDEYKRYLRLKQIEADQKRREEKFP